MLIPRHELLATINRVRNNGTLISLGLLVGTVLLVVGVSRNISSSLGSLAREAEMVREFRFDTPITVRSRVREVDDLAETMASGALSDEVGKQIVIAGYGNAGHGSTGSVESMGVQRAGLNRYDTAHDLLFLAYDFDSGLPENDSLGLSGFESDLGFGVDEVMGANGDSGGPSFIGGAIAGVYSGTARHDTADVNDTLDHSWGEAGFDARVSLHQEFLIDATDGQVVFVPEPSTWGLLTLGSLFMGLFRKING